jgi:hypothetical protein
VWAVDAERVVVAVARVDPGLVGQLAEDPLLDVVDERGEVLRGAGLADSAGEQWWHTAGNTAPPRIIRT